MTDPYVPPLFRPAGEPAQQPASRRVVVALATLTGWLTAVAAGLALIVATATKDTPPDDGAMFASGDVGLLLAALVLGAPALVLGWIIGAVLVAVLLRGRSSGLLAGTIAAAGGLVIGAVVVGLFWGVLA